MREFQTQNVLISKPISLSISMFIILFASMINLIFLILFHRNVTYLYVKYLNGFSDLIIYLCLLKLSFAGFSLGLILFKRLKKSVQIIHPFWLLLLLSYITLLSMSINFINIPDNLMIAIPLSFIFVSSFLYGYNFAVLLENIKNEYNTAFFWLLIGASLGIVIYNYIFVYLYFVCSYLLLFILFQLVLLFLINTLGSKTNKKLFAVLAFQLIVSFIGLAFYLNKPLIPAVDYPYKNTNNLKQYLRVMGPNGVLDVFLGRDSKYVMLSDLNSQSPISIKGDIDNLGKDVTIPFMLRKYDSSLHIGIGGGKELVAALYYGSSKIVGVEIDEERIELMKTTFKEYSKELFFDNRIKIEPKGGRQFLRQNHDKFDLISIQRPWTIKHTQYIEYQPSAELFTEEAFEEYLKALNPNGIIYWALPKIGHIRDPALITIKQKLNKIKDRIIILTPHKESQMVSILIGTREQMKRFYVAYKDDFQFIYYPTMELKQNKNEIIDYLFFDKRVENNNDKYLFKRFDRDTIIYNFIFILVCLLLIFLVFWKFLSQKYAIYLYLGIGHEVVGIFFLSLLVIHFGNFTTIMPACMLVYFLGGSFGYLHAKKVNTRIIGFICLVIVVIFSSIIFADHFKSIHFSTSTKELVILAAFLIVSYLITFPFGYMIAHENEINKAYSIDYFGSILAIFVVILLQNIDYFLALSCLIYSVVGAMLYLNKKI